MKPIELDDFDRRILAMLQRDNSVSQQVIGDAVSLSAPAVQRRIRRLQETGVISANVAVVNPGSVGQGVTVLVEIQLENERTELLEAAKQRFAAADEVQQCYYVTGEADLMLVVLVPSMQDYEALTQRLFFAGGNVKRFKSFVVMDRVKVGLAVNLGIVPFS